MKQLLHWLYDATGAGIYYQHAVCLTNDPIIMTLYIAGDLTVWVSYIVIGFCLFIARKHTMRFSTQALSLYAAFIFMCGLSHLTKTMMLFVGAYRIDVIVVAMTAAVSAITAGLTLRETMRSEEAWSRQS
jgi:hypothetical protein